MKIRHKKSLKASIIISILTLVLALGFCFVENNQIFTTYNGNRLEENLSKYAIMNQNDFSSENEYISEKVEQIKVKSGFDYDYVVTDYLPAAYEVELITPNGNIFIEGSHFTNSIFFNTSYEEYYYGGVNHYYGKSNGIWINLLTDVVLDDAPKVIMEFNFENANKKNDIILSEMSTSVNGYKVINNHNYFRTLTNIPNHVNINKVYPGSVAPNINPGTCGVVATSMLLGYYQNYTDWNIIPQSNFRNGNGTNDAFAEYLFKSWIWDGKSIGAEGTIMGTYDIVSSKNAGFPMASVENKVLIEKYSKSNNQKYKHNASSWFPKTNVEKHINSDTPSIGTTTAYRMNNEELKEKSFHNVIIYGYASSKYLCHMGWGAGSTSYTEVVLSELALHSYYTISK